MGEDVNDSPKDDRPRGSLVEGDVLVKRDYVVQGCLTQKGDEVPAHREQNEGNVDVKNEGSSPSDGWRAREETQLEKELGEPNVCAADRKPRTEPVSEHSPRVVVIVI